MCFIRTTMDIVKKLRDAKLPLECIIGHLVLEVQQYEKKVQQLEEELTSANALITNLSLILYPPLSPVMRMPYDNSNFDRNEANDVGDGANKQINLREGPLTETVFTGEGNDYM